MTGCGFQTLSSVDSTGISGYGSKEGTLNHTVDNTAYSYLIYAYSTEWDTDLNIKGALITYTAPTKAIY
jgi:hypothetical protein